MLARGYFAHDERGREVRPPTESAPPGVRYAIVGENLALAPTVELAHHGLMESPGTAPTSSARSTAESGSAWRTRGLHGKMFTQDFAD